MQYLDNQFQDRVISRRTVRGTDWPTPQSGPLAPRLLPLGLPQEQGLHPRPTTLDVLEANIRREVAAVDPDMVID